MTATAWTTGETEIRFENLYQRADNDWEEAYRAELPGTMEYQHKQEAVQLAEAAGVTWMDAGQQEQFRLIYNLIDTIKSGRDFYRMMSRINNNYEGDVINAAREYKKCFNSAQYGQPEEAGAASEGWEMTLGTPEAMAGMDAGKAAGGPALAL